MQQVCIWHEKGVSGGWSLAATPLELLQPVTAIDFAPGIVSKDKWAAFLMHDCWLDDFFSDTY